MLFSFIVVKTNLHISWRDFHELYWAIQKKISWKFVFKFIIRYIIRWTSGEILYNHVVTSISTAQNCSKLPSLLHGHTPASTEKSTTKYRWTMFLSECVSFHKKQGDNYLAIYTSSPFLFICYPLYFFCS